MSLLSYTETICPTALRPLLNRVKASPIAKRIASGAFWLILGNVIGRGLTFLSMIFVARILGPKMFGEFSLVRSTAMTFVTYSAFGMGLTATKYIAELLSSDKDRVGRIIGLSYLFTCFSSLLVASVFWFAAPLICESWIQKPHLVGLLQLGAVLLFLMTFCQSQQGVLSGFQDFRGLAFSNIISGIAMAPIYVVGTYYWGLVGAVTGTVIAAALNAFVNSVFIYRNTKHHAIRYRFLQAGRELGVLGRFSLPSVLCGITFSTSLWGCQMMLGAEQDGVIQLGYFYAAFTIIMLITAIPFMVAPVYVAKLSELFSKGDMKRFRKTVILSFCTNGSIAIAVALPFLCFPSLLMEWCFGESFRAGGTTLVILCFTAILWIIGKVVDQVMISMGQLWFVFGYCLVGAMTTIIVAILTIPTWGSSGLALALLLGFCTRVVCYILFYPVLVLKTANSPERKIL